MGVGGDGHEVIRVLPGYNFLENISLASLVSYSLCFIPFPNSQALEITSFLFLLLPVFRSYGIMNSENVILLPLLEIFQELFFPF